MYGIFEITQTGRKPAFEGQSHDSIEAAIASLGDLVAYWEADPDHDAADLFCRTGMTYVVERV